MKLCRPHRAVATSNLYGFGPSRCPHWRVLQSNVSTTFTPLASQKLDPISCLNLWRSSVAPRRLNFCTSVQKNDSAQSEETETKQRSVEELKQVITVIEERVKHGKASLNPVEYAELARETYRSRDKELLKLVLGILPAVSSNSTQDYSVLIHVLAKEMMKLREASQLFARMKEAKIPRNTEIYAALIEPTLKRHGYDEAWKLLEEMEEEGITPTVRILNVFLAHSRKDSDYTRTLTLMKRMKQDLKMSFDIVTFNTLIRLTHLRGDLERIRAMFEQIPQEGLKRDDITFLLMLKAIKYLGEPKDFKDAFDLMDLMKQEGIEPNTKHYNLLASICVRDDDVVKAVELAKLMTEKRMKLSKSLFHDLVHKLTTRGRVTEALAMVDEMHKQGHTITDTTLRALRPKSPRKTKQPKKQAKQEDSESEEGDEDEDEDEGEEEDEDDEEEGEGQDGDDKIERLRSFNERGEEIDDFEAEEENTIVRKRLRKLPKLKKEGDPRAFKGAFVKTVIQKNNPEDELIIEEEKEKKKGNKKGKNKEEKVQKEDKIREFREKYVGYQAVKLESQQKKTEGGRPKQQDRQYQQPKPSFDQRDEKPRREPPRKQAAYTEEDEGEDEGEDEDEDDYDEEEEPVASRKKVDTKERRRKFQEEDEEEEEEEEEEEDDRPSYKKTTQQPFKSGRREELIAKAKSIFSDEKGPAQDRRTQSPPDFNLIRERESSSRDPSPRAQRRAEWFRKHQEREAKDREEAEDIDDGEAGSNDEGGEDNEGGRRDKQNNPKNNRRQKREDEANFDKKWTTSQSFEEWKRAKQGKQESKTLDTTEKPEREQQFTFKPKQQPEQQEQQHRRVDRLPFGGDRKSYGAPRQQGDRRQPEQQEQHRREDRPPFGGDRKGYGSPRQQGERRQQKEQEQQEQHRRVDRPPFGGDRKGYGTPRQQGDRKEQPQKDQNRKSDYQQKRDTNSYQKPGKSFSRDSNRQKERRDNK